MDRSKWEYKKLGEVCEILDKLRKPVTKSDRVAGQYPYYGATGIQDYVANYIFDGRYLLLGEDGAKWGANDRSAFIIEGKTWVNNHAHILKINSDYMDVFVMYYLNHKDLSEYITGAVVPKLTQAAMAKIPVPYINIADQQRIVAELDCLNEMIALKQEQLKEFDKLAQSIFYDMFGDPVTNEKGWDRIKLGDICTCITKGTTPTTLGFPFVEEGVNFVKVESFVDGKIAPAKLTHITNECNLALSRSQLENEDLLVCIAGATIGKMAFVDTSILPANTNQACAIIRLKEKKNLRFIHSFLTLKLKNDIIQMGKGVAQPNLSLGQLRDFMISFPPLALQQQFAEKIQAIEAQKELVKKSIAETQQLLDSRMDYYFD